MTQTYHDPPNLPLTHAASVALMREMMAKNPGAHPFALWENNHIEVDPHLFVPTMVVGISSGREYLLRCFRN